MFKIFIVSFFVFSYLGFSVSAEAWKINPMCSPQNVFRTPNSGGFALDQDERNRAVKAMDWIYSMVDPINLVSAGGNIDTDQIYDYDYVGPVLGSFSLDNPSDFPVTNESPLSVVLPVGFNGDGSYRGVVTGTSNISTAGTHHVKAYLFTDQEYEQPAVVPGVVAADGTWSLDLAPVPANFSGEWRFRLYEIASNTMLGKSWPQPDILNNLQISLYSVTDAEYFSSSIKATPDFRYRFETSFSGTKRMKLIDNKGTQSTSDDVVLASFNNPTGIVRSYELSPGDTGHGTPFEERGYVYDQALALSSAISLNDRVKAEFLAKGLIQFQQKTGAEKGAFYFSAPQLAAQAADPIYRVGAHSVGLYSLLQYIEYNPTDVRIQDYKDSAADALGYLQAMKSTTGPQSGLYLGGSGRYVNDVFENYVIPWASTEHNLDTWHALKKASLVLGRDDLKDSADSLQEAILSKLWNPSLKRFYQGYGPTSPDSADALDTSSWGSMMLAGINDYEKTNDALDRVKIYKFADPGGVTGWGPYSSAGGYPNATPTVWYEGSFGVLMAFARNNLDQDYQSTLDNLKRGQLASGAFPYATQEDTRYEIITAPSVASTAWYILSTVGIDDFWKECNFIERELSKKNSKSSVKYSCKDKTAINYDQFGRHKQDLCVYATSVKNPFGGQKCSARLIVKDYMKKGDRNGQYSAYNKGVVNDINLLQSHINRILGQTYEQAAGPSDGIFGPLTKRGVERLQNRLNEILGAKIQPLVIDGIVGPFTLSAINQSC